MVRLRFRVHHPLRSLFTISKHSNKLCYLNISNTQIYRLLCASSICIIFIKSEEIKMNTSLSMINLGKRGLIYWEKLKENRANLTSVCRANQSLKGRMKITFKSLKLKKKRNHKIRKRWMTIKIKRINQKMLWMIKMWKTRTVTGFSKKRKLIL